MLNRNDYIIIIEEIRNLPKKGVDAYIDNKLIPLQKENPYFIETLYKDIFYIIENIGEKDEGDLVIENGDFAMNDENDDFKLSGYQTRLDDVATWLHLQVVNKIQEGFVDYIQNHKSLPEDYDYFLEKMKIFEKTVLYNRDYTPEYRAKLDAIRDSILKERHVNYNIPRFKEAIKKYFIDIKNGFKLPSLLFTISVVTLFTFMRGITQLKEVLFIVLGSIILNSIFEFTTVFSKIDKKYYLIRLKAISLKLPFSILLSLLITVLVTYNFTFEKTAFNFISLWGVLFVFCNEIIKPKK